MPPRRVDIDHLSSADEISENQAPGGRLSTRELIALLHQIHGRPNRQKPLRARLLEITDRLARQLELPSVSVFVTDSRSSEVDCLASSVSGRPEASTSQTLSPTVVAELATSQETLLVERSSPDAAQPSRAIFVPIREGDSMVAVLAVEGDEGLIVTDANALAEALEVIGQSLAGVLARRTLQDEIEERSEQLAVLAEASRLALSQGDLDGRLERLTSYLRRHFELEVAAVLVSDESGKTWEHRAITTLDPKPLPDRRWAVTEGVVGRAIRTRRTQLVLDVQADPDYFSIRDDIVAELAIPLRFHEHILGAFNLETSDAKRFSRGHVRLFEAIADQVAGAIELAFLYGRLEESRNELQSVNRELQRLTLVDGLTGVANRRQLETRLVEEWNRARRHREPLTFVLFDVDHFKAYNDTYGHPAGDECLRSVAQALSKSLERAGDLVARYGGEEFAVLLPRVDTKGAARAVERARLAVADLAIPHRSSLIAENVSVSAGFASHTPVGDDLLEGLVARSDAALYRAKRLGRDRSEPG